MALLLEAVRNNDLEAVKARIAAGDDVEYTNTEAAEWPLLLAAEDGNLEMVQLLIKAGATADSDRQDWGLTPLMQSMGHIEVMRVLLPMSDLWYVYLDEDDTDPDMNVRSYLSIAIGFDLQGQPAGLGFLLSKLSTRVILKDLFSGYVSIFYQFHDNLENSLIQKYLENLVITRHQIICTALLFNCYPERIPLWEWLPLDIRRYIWDKFIVNTRYADDDEEFLAIVQDDNLQPSLRYRFGDELVRLLDKIINKPLYHREVMNYIFQFIR